MSAPIQPGSLSLTMIRDQVGSWAAGEPLIRRVYLFGSRARSEPQPASDVDLAVLHDIDREVLRQCCGDFRAARLMTWMDNGGRWTKALCLRFPVVADLNPIERGDQYVRPAVKRDGVLLYRRTRRTG